MKDFSKPFGFSCETLLSVNGILTYVRNLFPYIAPNSDYSFYMKLGLTLDTHRNKVPFLAPTTTEC
jgi:hypothetical protein